MCTVLKSSRISVQALNCKAVVTKKARHSELHDSISVTLVVVRSQKDDAPGLRSSMPKSPTTAGFAKRSHARSIVKIVFFSNHRPLAFRNEGGNGFRIPVCPFVDCIATNASILSRGDQPVRAGARGALIFLSKEGNAVAAVLIPAARKGVVASKSVPTKCCPNSWSA